jgi:hypothetical protein
MGFSVTADELVLALQGTTERLSIRLNNDDGDLVDAVTLTVELRSLGGEVILQDHVGTFGSRIVHPSTGHYYVVLGDPNAPVSGVAETQCPGDYLAIWHVAVDDGSGTGGTDVDNFVQSIKVVSPYILDLVGRLRRQIDKTVKLVSEDPDDPCYLGYTTKNLLEYLEGGLSTWNLYEPYPTFCSLHEFPVIYRQGLIEAALLVGVQSQELFAIDNDIPNYSAQGAAFVIQHQPALAAFLTRMAQRLDKLIPIAKLKLVRSGSVRVELGPNYRLQQLINMAPSGALFRNLYIRA